MARKNKKASTYQPRGPTASPAGSPSAARLQGSSTSKRTASQTGLDDEEQGPADEELELISEGILSVRTSLKLSNRSANRLNDLDIAYVKQHNLEADDSDDQIDGAPEKYLLEQGHVLLTIDKLDKLEQTIKTRAAATPSAAAAASSRSAPNATPLIEPETLTKGAKVSHSSAKVYEVFLSPSNPRVAAGGTIIIQTVFRRLKWKPELLGARGNLLLDKANKSARRKIISYIKNRVTRIRCDLKDMLRASMEGQPVGEIGDADLIQDDGKYPWGLLQLADQVAKKWEVGVSYDLMCRLAWLRKTAKETVTFDDGGSECWDLVQLELDAILKLLNHKDAREREKGAK
ncbi:hypothetical protein V8E36_009296 [Tilletia maclaganii]